MHERVSYSLLLETLPAIFVVTFFSQPGYASFQVPDETCQTYVAKNMVCDPYHICHNCEPEKGTCFPIKAGSYTGYKVTEWGIIKGNNAI